MFDVDVSIEPVVPFLEGLITSSINHSQTVNKWVAPHQGIINEAHLLDLVSSEQPSDDHFDPN